MGCPTRGELVEPVFKVADKAFLPALSKRIASNGPADELERRIRRSYELVDAKLPPVVSQAEPTKTQATLKS